VATRAHTVPRFYLSNFVSPESERSKDPFTWVATISSGEIKRRAPKNLSIARGFYDGPGCFEEPTASLEEHLAKIEWAAASAIKRFIALPAGSGGPVAAEIWRLLAWQAARTPGWLDLVEAWANEWDPNSPEAPTESPPDGFDQIQDKVRGIHLEFPASGERRTVHTTEEFAELRHHGWKWIIGNQDRLEMIHMQAWYFRVRHFARLSWMRLDAPGGEVFITSDRGVTWMVDGFADTPPSALRHTSAQVVAPLSRSVALVGRHGSQAGKLRITPREVNRFIACTTSGWIAGPNQAVVEAALHDRKKAHAAQ
jgi:hypothetical protein